MGVHFDVPLWNDAGLGHPAPYGAEEKGAGRGAEHPVCQE